MRKVLDGSEYLEKASSVREKCEKVHSSTEDRERPRDFRRH